ncbi:uncharacterized protein A4U43_C08F33460 [Asparagus officinalis]|nr:uncharacterized protein A4U43_C08F33460 [Asparagus officinalis]
MGRALLWGCSNTNPDIEVEKDELKPEANKAEEEWKKALEIFKEEAIKMKAMSEEAYEVYSKQAIVMLNKTSETLKIQAEKARQDLNVIANQISEEGKVYLSKAAEESPEPIKDVVETFASSTNELKEISAVRDFHLGIPYGAFLSIGGFLWFMLTGSTSAIRFGVILGSALLALSVASLRSWKSGQSSERLLKGQAAIATIIFLREWRLFCQTRFFSTGLMTLISGAMVAFYVYRIIISGGSSSKGPASEHSSEN